MALEETETTNQYRSLQELDSRMESIRSELSRIDGIDEPTEEDLNWQSTLISEYDAIELKAAPLRKRMHDIERVMRGPASDPANREDAAPKKAPEMFVRSNRDPLEDLDRVRAGMVPPSEMRNRARDLIEQDDKRHVFPGDDAHRMSAADQAEHAYKRAEGDYNGKVAQHILLTGSREYREAFRSYLETGSDNSFRAIALSATSGGYLLPYVLDPTIVLTNNASSNPYRRVSRIVQTTSNAWQGVNSAGVTAAFVAEATTAADASPTVGQIQIIPQKAAAWIMGTYEALDDTNFGQQLPGLLADAKDRLESAYFTTGAGSASGVPLGVMAALGTGSRVAPSATGTAVNGTASVADVYALQGALPPRFRQSPNAAFMGNIALLNKVRGIDQYGGGSFWSNLTSNTPASLLGQPVYEASDMNAVSTGTSAASGTGSATILYGDFSQFIIVDRVGVSMLYDPMLKGTGANAQLPVGEAGWYMFWRVSSGVSTTAAFRYTTIS